MDTLPPAWLSPVASNNSSLPTEITEKWLNIYFVAQNNINLWPSYNNIACLCPNLVSLLFPVLLEICISLLFCHFRNLFPKSPWVLIFEILCAYMHMVAMAWCFLFLIKVLYIRYYSLLVLLCSSAWLLL